MVKLEKTSDFTPQKSLKVKARKNKSLMDRETPDNRRKSLPTVFPTPRLEKKSKVPKMRKSIAAFPVPQFEENVESQYVQIGSSITGNMKPTSKKNKENKLVPTSINLKKPRKKQNKMGDHESQISSAGCILSVEDVKKDEKTMSNIDTKSSIRKTSLILVHKNKSSKMKKPPLVKADDTASSESNGEFKLKLEHQSSKNKTIVMKKIPKLEKDDNKFVLNISELENKHNILLKDVKNAVEGVIKFATNNPKLQNQLFNTEIPLFLQINSFKIPNTRGPVKHVFRVPLEHSILTAESDICLIVPDVKGIPNKELERHQEHYEKLLADKGVRGIKKIMTFYEFRTEYETFELKNRLADLYDVFLVDGKISGKVVHKAGKIFYKKRKIPNPVKLQASKLADHIGKSLKKVYFDMNTKSDSCMVQFGHSKMTTKELIDNAYSVVQFLDNKFPGRMDNIKSLYVYAHRGSSIPIYVSLANPNVVKIPTIKHQKPKAYKSLLGELTTQYNADVLVRPSCKVIVRRNKSSLEPQGDDEITYQDMLSVNKQEGEEKKASKKRKSSENAADIKQKNVEENKPINIKKEKMEIKEELLQIKKMKPNKKLKLNRVKKHSKN